MKTKRKVMLRTPILWFAVTVLWGAVFVLQFFRGKLTDPKVLLPGVVMVLCLVLSVVFLVRYFLLKKYHYQELLGEIRPVRKQPADDSFAE